jgi:hypothetical protein
MFVCETLLSTGTCICDYLAVVYQQSVYMLYAWLFWALAKFLAYISLEVVNIWSQPLERAAVILSCMRHCAFCSLCRPCTTPHTNGNTLLCRSSRHEVSQHFVIIHIIYETLTYQRNFTSRAHVS